METQVKCVKCGKEYLQSELKQTKKGVLCKQCQRKAKIRNGLIALVCCLGLGGGIAALSIPNNDDTMDDFMDSAVVQAEIPVEVPAIPQKPSIINEESGVAIGNLEDFIRMTASVFDNDEATQTSVISVPKIFCIFDFASSAVSEEAKKLLLYYANVYSKTNQEATIFVEGFGCNIGSVEANMRISKERAERVRQILEQYGIDPGKINIAYYGKNRNNEFNYATNADYRRVIVSIK